MVNIFLWETLNFIITYLELGFILKNLFTRPCSRLLKSLTFSKFK